MRGLRGVLAGSLALVALHTVVAYRGPNERLEQLVGPRGVLVRAVERFLDPTVPAIGERAGAGDKVVGARVPRPAAVPSPATPPAPRQPTASRPPTRPPANAI